jgi:hypothetical protein
MELPWKLRSVLQPLSTVPTDATVVERILEIRTHRGWQAQDPTQTAFRSSHRDRAELDTVHRVRARSGCMRTASLGGSACRMWLWRCADTQTLTHDYAREPTLPYLPGAMQTQVARTGAQLTGVR